MRDGERFVQGTRVPMLKIGGNFSRLRAKLAHLVAVAHFGGLVLACLAEPVDGNDRVSFRNLFIPSCFPSEKGCDGRDILICPAGRILR